MCVRAKEISEKMKVVVIAGSGGVPYFVSVHFKLCS
jgi:hypothetical protein